MISIGIDVSKGKSTVCILKPYGEILCSPYEIHHDRPKVGEAARTARKTDTVNPQ